MLRVSSWIASSALGFPIMIEIIQSAPALADRIRERIRRKGPITFCEWMRMSLYDEQAGYYCRTDRQKWGRAGDYRTSPERSSLFAATFAGYFAELYQELGQPSEWTIVETGAGDGLFAAGVLETLRVSFPSVFSATHYVVDEASQHSRALARERLSPFADHVSYEALNDAEVNSGVVFSNELLDAFPVHRVVMQKGQLQEFYVTEGNGESFEWTIGAPSTSRLADYFEQCHIQLAEGRVAEVNLGIEKWLTKVFRSLHTGYLITVDYGATAEELYCSAARDQGTLRSFFQHRLIDDVLMRPGEQDITTTIDWSFVQDIGKTLGLETIAFERQDKFLLAAGLLDKLEVEMQRSESEADKLRLSTAAREMILPDVMAAHFQVLVQKKIS
jgi:SAM-dependent MidA family methyltransferase